VRMHNQVGYIRYFCGRKRRLPDIDLSGRWGIHKAETTLSNNVCQGSGQDFLKAAVIRCDWREPNPDRELPKRHSLPKEHVRILADYAARLDGFRRRLKRARSQFIMQVHDEVIISVCDDLEAAKEVLEIWATVMTWRHFIPAGSSYNVPLVAEGGVAKNWHDAKSENALFHVTAGFDEWARYQN